MTAHTIRQAKALAQYTAQLRKNSEAKRQRRLNEMRRKLVRQMFRDKSGWMFATLSLGIAAGVFLTKFN